MNARTNADRYGVVDWRAGVGSAITIGPPAHVSNSLSGAASISMHARPSGSPMHVS